MSDEKKESSKESEVNGLVSKTGETIRGNDGPSGPQAPGNPTEEAHRSANARAGGGSPKGSQDSESFLSVTKAALEDKAEWERKQLDLYSSPTQTVCEPGTHRFTCHRCGVEPPVSICGIHQVHAEAAPAADKLTEALVSISRYCGYSADHLGADNYTDPGVVMAREIIETMRDTAAAALLAPKVLSDE